MFKDTSAEGKKNHRLDPIELIKNRLKVLVEY